MTATTELLIGRTLARAVARLEDCRPEHFVRSRSDARRAAHLELTGFGLSAATFLDAVRRLNSATERQTVLVAAPVWAMAFAC